MAWIVRGIFCLFPRRIHHHVDGKTGKYCSWMMSAIANSISFPEPSLPLPSGGAGNEISRSAVPPRDLQKRVVQLSSTRRSPLILFSRPLELSLAYPNYPRNTLTTEILKWLTPFKSRDFINHNILISFCSFNFSRQVQTMCYAVTKKSLPEMPAYVKIPVILTYAFVVHFGLSYFMVAFNLLTIPRFHRVGKVFTSLVAHTSGAYPWFL